MNLNYSQSTGQMTKDDGTLVATGFAGNNSRPGVNPKHLQGMNNPDMQSVHCIGPLPQGTYTVGTWGLHHPVGPNSAPLTQTSGETFGRNAFFIHGPGDTDPMNSSEGCICIHMPDRQKVIDLNPDQITVTA